MKHLFYAIFTLLLLSTASCIEDGFATGSGDVLEFSTDTLSFDTVFTGETTATKRFVVYNRHKKQLRIERIFLSGAPEGAEFYLNVDGRSGKEFSDIEVRGEDSIYVFVEARIDATDADLPFDVFDHLNFVTNGTQQSVVIRAAGQNAVTLSDFHVSGTETLSPERPYRVMDSIVVEKNAVLKIPAGTIVYFHDKACLKVRGSLVAEGTVGNPVTFRGDRLDKVAGSIPFELMSGQWDGIHIEKESFGNELSHAVMHSSSNGIVVDSCGVLDRMKLRICNSVLHNSAASVLKASHAWVEAVGCEFSDSKDGVDKVYDNPLMEASFDNCIVYGNAADISIGDLAETNVYLRNCLLRSRGENDDRFIDCLWDADPKFYTVRDEYIFDYRLQDESDAIGAGNAALCPENARYDFYGNDRFQSGALDLGAYVWIPQTEETDSEN